MRTELWAAGAAALALAGCGGGGGGGGGGGPAGPLEAPQIEVAPASFADHAARGDAIFAEASSLGYSDPAALPGSGVATYTGQMGVYVEGDPLGLGPSGALRADLRVAAGFATDEVLATAGNFVTGEDVQLEGEILFHDGVIRRDLDVEQYYTFVLMDAEGTLTAPDGLAVTTHPGGGGTLFGDFLGPDESFVVGEATLVLGLYGDNHFWVYSGGFEAERD